MKINEIIVVEGKKDTIKIKQAVEADTIETNGSAVSQSTLEMIKHASTKRGVIIFTDPDYPGERIRHIVDKGIPGCKHAFLPKREAKSYKVGKSVGIEHASVEAIRRALDHVYGIMEATKADKAVTVQKQDLMPYGLIAGPDARARREALGDYLHIGYTNGKQLVKRLNMFQITKDELDAAMLHILERGDCDE